MKRYYSNAFTDRLKQDAMNLLKIEQLDYSVVNTTDVFHIKEIYLKSRKYRGGTACEVGSLGGHGTFSLCLAGLNVTSYDNDGHKGFKDKRFLEIIKRFKRENENGIN